MVDRSEPLVVTPQACPFVALDSDRDQRLTAPDARHRCFAEAAPKARSMGHQASFCLTPAFTGCPIFLDWASRVAADVLPGRAPAGAGALTDGPSSATSTTATGSITSTTATGAITSTGATGAITSTGATTATTATATVGTVPSAAAAPGASASVPVAGAPSSADPARPTTDAHPTGATPAWAAAPPWIAEAAPPPPDIFDTPARRTARLDIAPGPASPSAAGVDARTSSPGAGSTGAPAPAAAVTAPVALERSVSPADAAERDAELAASTARTDLLTGADGAGSGSSSTSAGPSVDGDTSDIPEADETGSPPWARGRRVPMDAGAPASLGPQTRPGARPSGPREWEGARRFEAYAAGTGSRRFGRPVLIAIGAGLVAVALLVVFLLPSLFLSGGAAPTATPAASTVPAVAATRRPRPTPTAPGATPARPAATPQSYRVKRGDTLLRIGRRFNVTVEQLTCANDIRNPNSLSVGTTLVIPIETYQCPKPTKKPK